MTSLEQSLAISCVGAHTVGSSGALRAWTEPSADLHQQAQTTSPQTSDLQSMTFTCCRSNMNQEKSSNTSQPSDLCGLRADVMCDQFLCCWLGVVE